MMTRRGLFGGLGAALVPGRKPQEPPKPQTAIWDIQKCPGCGQVVCFTREPWQRRNRCAWCGRVVRHGLG